MLDNIPRSHFYSTATIIIWSYAYVGTRLIVTEHSVGSAELCFIRNSIAMLLFILLMLARRTHLPALRDIPIFLLSGGFGFALYMYMFAKGLETITGGTSAILLATIPLITAVISSLVFQEKLPLLGWLAMGVSFSGAALLSLWHGTFSVDVGVAWTLAAAVAMSLYNIIQRYLARRAVRPYDSLQITAYSFIAAVALSLFLVPSSAEQFMAASSKTRLLIVTMGIFPSALAFLLWAKAISIANSLNSVINYLFLVPFVVLIACFLALDELPDEGALVGGPIILVGLWLYNKAMRLQQGRNTAKKI